MQDMQLVRYIVDEGGVAPATLATHLGIKERAMRDRIRRANDAMGSRAQIVYDRASARYTVNISDEQALTDWLNAPLFRDAAGHVPTTPRERTNYLMQDLLSRTDWTTLEDLASVLFVSRSTLSSDLRAVEQAIARFGLTIERRPCYGIRVAGSEMGRRLCMANLAADARLAANGLAGTIAPDMFDDVDRCVSATLAGEHYKINPVSHQNLVVHIVIALKRIEKGCYVPMDDKHLATVRGTREYAVARVVAADIERAFHVELPEEEVAYIAIHLASKHLIEGEPAPQPGGPTAEGASAGTEDGEAAEPNLDISDEAWNLASEMVELVWRAFRFDFRDDAELRMSLARHIQPLIVRVRYHMTLENPLLDDIKSRYLLPFSMAVDAMSILAERYDAVISDDETGYLALIFALALERQRTERVKKRVLVVCASGAGSARLLAYRLKQEFSANFESVDTCDVSDFADRDLADIDYIFTTVPLARHVSVPVVNINLFLDDVSRRDVHQALKQAASPNINDYLRPELFFAGLDLATREEVIAFLCEQARAFDELPANFEDLVWKRERAAATAFGNMVALPHPYEAVASRTFVAVALLNQAIDWNGVPVQAVFLVCVARDAGANLEGFYRSMAGVLTSKQAIQNITDSMRFETLLDELKGV